MIFANKLACDGLGSLLPRVGALPVLLRAVLGAQKAGASRVAVVVDREATSSIVRDLQSTGRLPASIEWFEFETVGMSLTSLLGQIIGAWESTVLLIYGDRTYHPSLHRDVAEWQGNGGALALRTGTRAVGMYALSGAVAQDLANGQASIHGLEELDACLVSIRSVEIDQSMKPNGSAFPLSKSTWPPNKNWTLGLSNPRMESSQNEPQGLDSDQPPSHQISDHAQYGQSVHSRRQLYGRRVFFIGRLLECLLGAVLSVFASILDGSDGEVARLKLQESDFGCWLETICD